MKLKWNLIINLVFVLSANGMETVDLNTAQELLTKEINQIHETCNKKYKTALKYKPNTIKGIDHRLVEISLNGKVGKKHLDELLKNIKSSTVFFVQNTFVGAEELMHREINRFAQYHEIEITQKQWDAFNSNLTNNLIENPNLPKLIYQITSNINFRCQNKLHTLPTNIRNLENIYYFKTNQQPDGFSCGFWTCFNANAIEQLINKTINLVELNTISQILMNSTKSNSLHQLASNQNHKIIKKLYMKEEQLRDFEMEAIAESLGLNNFNLYNQNMINLDQIYNLRLNQNKLFVIKLNTANPNDVNAITVNQKTIIPNHLDVMIQRALTAEQVEFTTDPRGEDVGIENRPQERAYEEMVDETARLVPKLNRKFFRKLKQDLDAHVGNNTPTAIYFACQTNRPHWILISILKLPDRKPVMTICDSLNYKIISQTEYQEYIQILHKIFIEPYMDDQDTQTVSS